MGLVVVSVLTPVIPLVIVVAYTNPVKLIGQYYPYLFLAYLILILALNGKSRAPLIAGIALMVKHRYLWPRTLKLRTSSLFMHSVS